MCYNDFKIKIKLFKYKRFKDGRCIYKNTEFSHLNTSHYPYTSPHPTAGRDGHTFFQKKA